MRRFALSILVAVVVILGLTTVPKPAYSWWTYTPGASVDNVGYAPTQPIPFSHKLHAGDKQIPCQYCHSSARRAQDAGIPSLNTCMGCHKLVATDRPDIKTITEHYKKNEPMEWVKVNVLPDYVRFAHNIHVNAGLSCQGCHGEVQKMSVVDQEAPLLMGWCIGCHKEKQAKTDCIACHY